MPPSTSLDAKGLEAATMKRELDLTINQRLNVNFTDRESGAADHARKSLAMVEKDISSFARFLSQNLCLEVLLFWKEVEQYKTLFTPEERVALFSKIYELYCVEGAHWQVNFRGAHVETMKKCFKKDGSVDSNLDEDIFDAAQQEVYELMRLDLFPRFNEHLSLLAGGGLADEAVAENLSQVLSGTNPPATRSFTRFCRHELCEEALLFPTGFAANSAVLGALASSTDVAIFSDALNHASIVDGARLAATAGIPHVRRFTCLRHLFHQRWRP